MNTRSRAWCFTLNNFVEHGWSNWRDRLSRLPNVKYLVCEEEVGNEGTPHLQGYVNFLNARTFDSMKKFFDNFAHIEVARGDAFDNKKYCTKDNVHVLEIGEPPKSTKKVDYEAILNDYENMSINDFIHKYPRESLLWYNKIVQISNARYQEQPQSSYIGPLSSKNYWIYGDPGTGKSFWARHQCKNTFLKSCNKWWSGYNHRFEMVLMEDFPPFEQTKGSLGYYMKLWCDRYTFTAEIKGGHMFIHPKDYVLIITSNYSIEECFSSGDVEAIKRRFREVKINGKDDLWFQCVMEIDDILRGNCTEDHAVHCT